MRRATLFLIFLYTATSLFAQNKPLRSFTAENLNKKFELYQKEFGDVQYLLIKNDDDKLIEKKKIDSDNYIEIDPYSFKAVYTGQRNFAIIGGLHRFHIVNLSNDKIIGPFFAPMRKFGEAQDGQTGAVGNYAILDNGQYLLFHAIDLGIYCYSLVDLYNPKDVPFFKSDSIIWKSSFVFIDKRKENIFNGITSSIDGNYSKDMETKMLFKGFRFQLDGQGELKSEIKDNRYLVLEQILPDSQIKPLIIDMDEGILVEEDVY